MPIPECEAVEIRVEDSFVMGRRGVWEFWEFTISFYILQIHLVSHWWSLVPLTRCIVWLRFAKLTMLNDATSSATSQHHSTSPDTAIANPAIPPYETAPSDNATWRTRTVITSSPEAPEMKRARISSEGRRARAKMQERKRRLNAGRRSSEHGMQDWKTITSRVR